jgi:hypothetical protein
VAYHPETPRQTSGGEKRALAEGRWGRMQSVDDQGKRESA